MAVGLLLALIVVYGALLRFDALFDSFGSYTQPAWLATWQPVVAGAGGVSLRFWYVSVTPVGARSRDGLESG